MKMNSAGWDALPPQSPQESTKTLLGSEAMVCPPYLRPQIWCVRPRQLRLFARLVHYRLSRLSSHAAPI